MFYPVRFLVLPLLLLPVACGGQEGAGSQSAPAGANSGSQAKATPEEIAREFFDKARTNDEEGFFALLTEKARAGMEASDGGFDLRGSEMSEVKIGTAKIKGTSADVPATAVLDGEEQSLQLRMRREQSHWRVWGADVTTPDGMEFTVDFESLGDMFAAFEEELTDALEEAFSEMSMGGSPEEIREQRARFDDIAGLSLEDHEVAWKVIVQATNKLADELLREAVASSGLDIDPGPFGGRLRKRVSFELVGVSRVEIVELVCNEVGLYPVYPDPWDAAPHQEGEEARAKITFKEGPRPWPVTFAGPFLIELTELEEKAPYATGSLTLAVRALGLSPIVTGFQSDMNEVVSVNSIVDARTRNLNADAGVHFLSTPQVRGRYLVDTTTVDLKNLVREVESIAKLEGSVHLSIPAAVTENRWPRNRKKPQKIGEMTLKLQSWDSYTQFELQGDQDLDSIEVRMAGVDKDGEPLGTLTSDSSAAGNTLYASLQTHEPPAAIDLKICRAESVDYDFDIENIPLRHFMEMPERLKPLAFNGDTPLVAEFVRFTKRNEDFPQAELRIRNDSNKDALQTIATFVYLDSQGKKLEEFPHTLSGMYGMDGQEPLVVQGNETTQETVAFFMPAETASLRIRVDEVVFADATKWSRGN